MSKYNIAWHNSSKTMILTETDAKVTGEATVVSSLVYAKDGEIPEVPNPPEPGQHMRNVARQNGVEDFDLVTVVNQTDNDRLDRFEQEANKEKKERVERAAADAVIENRPYANAHSVADEAEDEDMTADHDPDADADQEDPEEPEAPEEPDLSDAEKEGDEDLGLPAYASITVKQLQEKTGSEESDKQTLYALYREQLSKEAPAA